MLYQVNNDAIETLQPNVWKQERKESVTKMMGYHAKRKTKESLWIPS